MVVFGDSLSDAGNTSFLTVGSIPSASSGYVSGAFTNGSNWLVTLANRLGENVPLASRTGGTNYAHGGSAMISSALLRPSLAEQVTSYVSGLSTPNVIPASDLHIIWGGANDLFGSATDAGRRSTSRTSIRANIDGLYQLGARRFLVMNLPSLERTPLVKVDPSLDGAELDRVGDVFNLALSNELAAASTSLAGVDITEFDAAAFLDSMIADPAAFGLTNVIDLAAPFDPNSFIAGLATGLPASGINPDEYLFYDGLHPTSAVHSLFGNRVADVLTGVPEPSSMSAIMFGAFALCRARRRIVLPITDSCQVISLNWNHRWKCRGGILAVVCSFLALSPNGMCRLQPQDPSAR